MNNYSWYFVLTERKILREFGQFGVRIDIFVFESVYEKESCFFLQNSFLFELVWKFYLDGLNFTQ